MRTSLIALGLLAIGLSHCSGDRGLFVGADREDDGGGGEPESGGTGSGMSGGSGGGSQGGSENSGGTENTGGSGNRGGTGSGAEGGEPSETGGSGGSDRGGTDAGGTDTGGAGAGGAGAGGSGTAARGGMNDGGRAGSANAGAGAGGMNDGGRAGSANAGNGGAPTNDCEALGREYRERLAAAQQCSPQLTIEQCTIEMPDDFFCPCKTFVNPMRESDIRRMNEILEKRTSCARVCPAIACPDIRRGVCANGAMTTEPIVVAPGRCIGAI